MRVLMIAAAAAACLGALAVFWPGPEPVSHPWLSAQTGERVERIAHAGGLGRAPANTLEALEQAVLDGADVLEVDVWLTADGHPVLIHDETVDRTTDGEGRVADFRLEEISALDAAFGYEGEPADRFAGRGVRIPSLAEALAAYPDMRWIVEIKPDTREAAQAICTVIREAGMAGKALVGSFHDGAMGHFRQACPDVATGMARREALAFYIAARLGVANLLPVKAAAIQIPPRASGLEVAHPRLISAAQARGISVQVWTINDPAQMEALSALGVDGIITDRVDVMAALQRGEIQASAARSISSAGVGRTR